MKFTLAYNLSHHGWADATIQNEGKKYDIESISYLSDAFSNLSDAVLQLLTGSAEASCRLDHEPGQMGIRFIRDKENVQIMIYSFQNALADDPWEAGELVYNTETRLLRLKSQYLEEADNILKNNSLEEYFSRWGYEFPINIYNKIKSS